MATSTKEKKAPYTAGQMAQFRGAVKQIKAAKELLAQLLTKAQSTYGDNKAKWAPLQNPGYINDDIIVMNITSDQIKKAHIAKVTASGFTFLYGLIPLVPASSADHPIKKSYPTTSDAKYAFIVKNLDKALTNVNTALADAQKKLTDAQDKQSVYTANAAKEAYDASDKGIEDAKAAKEAARLAKYFAKDQTMYNVPAVKDAYFRDQKNLKWYQDSIYPTMTSGNAPTQVTTAQELWQTSIGNKGMFQAWSPPTGWKDGTKSVKDGGIPNHGNKIKYGFQFLYNPTTISMTYMGVAQTDVAYQMSGNDGVNYIPSVDATGSVSFSIPLNRMYDMQYYDENGNCTDLSQYEVNGRAPMAAGEKVTVTHGSTTITETMFENEQKTIYDKGTMYDIEFLLRVLIGFTTQSALRGSQWTADMGLFARRPVELHLGPEMRYRGYVSALSVNHVMFNERMVPIVSSLNITFNRYPDYPSSTSTAKK